MIKVQWVPNSQLYNDDMNYGLTKRLFTPVVTLADMKDIVAALRFIALSKDKDVVVIAQHLLVQLALEEE